MNIKRRLAALALVGALIGGGAVATGTTNAEAHTPEAWATCEAVYVKATNYETKPGTPDTTDRKLVSEAVVYQPAVYGEKPLISEAVAYQPAVYEVEYEYAHADNGNGNSNKTRWEKQGWNAGENGNGWVPTRATRNGALISAEVQAKDAVYGDAPLISAEVAAKDAVYETVTIPGTPANDYPNTVTITVDGTEVVNMPFGKNFSTSWALDATKKHDWIVNITSWNGIGTKTISGTTTPCAPAIQEIPYPNLLANEVCGADNDTVYVDPAWVEKYGHLVAGPWIDTKYKTIDGKRVVDGSAQIKAEFRKTYIWAGTSGTSASDYRRWQMYPGTSAFTHEDTATVCPPVEVPANPVAQIEAVCGVADITLTNPQNEGEANQTASFIVEVDGEFSNAYAVVANGSESVHLTFPEDSGDHTVEVFQAGTSEWKSIAEATVESDCAVVVPPTEEPKPEEPKAEEPKVITPVVKAAATTDDSTLAQTGGEVNPWLLAAGISALLAGAVMSARRLSTLRNRGE